MTAPDAAQEKIFETGNRIGLFAQRVFPNGVLVDEPYYEIEKAVAKTQELLKTAHTVYEAAFLYDNVLIRVDILHKTDSGWTMIEVKSSTSVKEEYYEDVSIQAYVLRGSGIHLNKAVLMHINNEYVKQTSDIDINSFFIQADITETLTKPEVIKETLLEMTEEMSAPEPEAKISKRLCGGCEFEAYCWQNVPEDSVYNLPRISDKAAFIASHGYLKISDVPPEYLTTERQLKWLDVYLTNTPYIDKNGISELLAQLNYPLYFLDFETTSPAIPIWQNTRPYQQIVFQASLHVMEHEGATLQHYEYLFEGKDDPRPKAAEFLLKNIGGYGSIIAHNAAFEKSRIAEMARDVDLPQKNVDHLKNMLTRFWDSKDPFQKYYLHPGFHCSASIKKVLPVIAPGMTYEGMAVGNGGDAMDAFDALYASKLSEEEEKQLRKDLLAYCAQDTLAMVKIVEFLKNII
jgi:CRISPR/Cas system-associated exonuclease Cas4 (RecB family)